MTRYLNPFSIASEEIDTEDAGLGCRGAKMVTTEQKSPPSIPAGVPQYVLDYAPLLHLYTADPYRPSSLSEHLTHTSPMNDEFQKISFPPPDLTLTNLDRLNIFADGSKSVYLTSNDDITKHPKWLEGIDVKNGGQKKGEEKTSVVVVVTREELGKGTQDVFYFYFFSFNWGGVVLDKQLGDHVGDWEHSMIRFVDGVPKYVWLSQHANGEAYTFDCLQKDTAGKRPLLYCANGSHALYATPGPHDHTIPNLNLPTPFLLVDETEAGPLYDSILASYYYTYTGPTISAPTGTFTACDPTTPIGYLNFMGKWGDMEYTEDDPRQKGKGLLGFKKYVSGPTGPIDKQLVRKDVWPQNELSGGQRIRKRLPIAGDKRTWLEGVYEKVGVCCRMRKAARTRKIRVSGEIVA